MFYNIRNKNAKIVFYWKRTSFDEIWSIGGRSLPWKRCTDSITRFLRLYIGSHNDSGPFIGGKDYAHLKVFSRENFLITKIGWIKNIVLVVKNRPKHEFWIENLESFEAQISTRKSYFCRFWTPQTILFRALLISCSFSFLIRIQFWIPYIFKFI